MSRTARFVKAARSLLLVQLVAAVIAAALGVWAVVAVRDLASERDRLRAQVSALESAQPGPDAPSATPAGPTPSPLDTEVRPPAILPMAIPVPATLPETNTLTPDGGVVATGNESENKVADEDTPNCSNPAVGDPRCGPRRWQRDPVLQRQTTPVRRDPQRPTPTDPKAN